MNTLRSTNWYDSVYLKGSNIYKSNTFTQSGAAVA
jgi:hypothetical protein